MGQIGLLYGEIVNTILNSFRGFWVFSLSMFYYIHSKNVSQIRTSKAFSFNGWSVISCKETMAHVLGVKFSPNPSISPFLSLKISKLVEYPFIIVTGEPVSNNMVSYVVYLFTNEISTDRASNMSKCPLWLSVACPLMGLGFIKVWVFMVKESVGLYVGLFSVGLFTLKCWLLLFLCHLHSSWGFYLGFYFDNLF